MKPSQLFLCPLCGSSNTQHFHTDKLRMYWRCEQCQLVFVDPSSLPTPDAERAEYDLHQNSVADDGYLQFLSRLCDPLCDKLTSPSTGLDFGCGPGPALQKILQSQGHNVSLYDPFYFPDESVLSMQYDFVTCTEAIEHFHRPNREWNLLLSLLKPGGWLAIMTKLVLSQERFAQWHYKNDQTHVSFFSRFTFDWLAERDHLNAEYFGNDVVLLQNREAK